jgi:thioredoxin 1
LQPISRKGVSTFNISGNAYLSLHKFFAAMAHEFTDATFQQEVIQSDKVTLIDLWAEWCGPCRMMTPIVEELSAEYKDRAVIGKLNVDDNPEVPTEYNVRGIPTFLLFKNGELKEKIVGAQTKQTLQNKINALLA